MDALYRLRTGILAVVLLAGSASPAGAVQITFDELAVGLGVAGQTFPGVSISSGVVIDDTTLGTLTLGGPFATSGDRGIYNTPSSAIAFEFDAPVSSFQVDVISLPNSTPSLLPILLQAYVGDTATSFDVSGAGALAETLSVSGAAITKVVLFPRVPCSLVDCETPQDVSDVYLDAAASFFADSVAFTMAVVPEPGTFTLLGGSLAALGLARRRRRAPRPKHVAAALLVVSGSLLGCVYAEVRIETPQQNSLHYLDPGDAGSALAIEIDLGEGLAPGGSLRVTLLEGFDTGPGTYRDISGDFTITDADATASLAASTLVEGINTLFVSVDRDGDSTVDFIATSTFTLDFDAAHSIARIWNEVLLDAIRVDIPRPTTHARNLFHLSVTMWDCWVAYDEVTGAQGYLYTQSHLAADVPAARHACISHAAHRLLMHRFQDSIGAGTSLPAIDAQMDALGYDKDFVPASEMDQSPEAVGYRVAGAVIDHGTTDGANEQNDYADPTYAPYNAPLIFKLPGTGFSIINPNRWTPLAFDFRCFQNDIPIPDGDTTQVFVGSQWNDVTPFALTRDDPNLPYVDPGPPPQAVQFDEDENEITGPGDEEFKQQMLAVARYSSWLDPDDGVMMNTSPGVFWNNSIEGIENGVLDGEGYDVNPYTGLPYPSNWVRRADWGRTIAEFWADGPSSETPPGHWNTIANYVSDHPLVEKRIGGEGPIVDALEWDVKVYLAVNGAVHDAAVAAWGAKRIYDYARPVAGIRWLIEQGQSSDPLLPSYSENGFPLEEGLSELITAESSAPGERHEHLADSVGEIALHVWPGEPNRELPPACGEDAEEPDPDVEIPPYSGTEWIRGVEWITYQRRTFVTPPFAAYVSGHSTFSRAAAEVLTRITGSPYFPGGLGTFVAPQNEFLVFETGPTQTVHLQWAQYKDAADEAGISRLWGGIHVQADDFNGRIMGYDIGISAYELAEQYWNGSVSP